MPPVLHFLSSSNQPSYTAGNHNALSPYHFCLSSQLYRHLTQREGALTSLGLAFQWSILLHVEPGETNQLFKPGLSKYPNKYFQQVLPLKWISSFLVKQNFSHLHQCLSRTKNYEVISKIKLLFMKHEICFTKRTMGQKNSTGFC